MQYWEIIADKLSAAALVNDYCSAVTAGHPTALSKDRKLGSMRI